MNKRYRRLAIYAGVIGQGVIGAQAYAQGARSPAPAADPANPAPEADAGDIVVTALKSRSSLHDTPATVQVVAPAALRAANVSSIQDLGRVAPGLQITPTGPGGAQPIALRGLTSLPEIITVDSSVATFYDGLFLPHAGGVVGSLYDLQNVQVVRGSQAALLGKNTSVGAIAIASASPTHEFGMSGTYSHEFELGSDRFEGFINVPMGSAFALRVAGVVNHDAGWVKNTLRQTVGPDLKRQGVRAKLLWQPDGANYDVTLSYQFDHSHRIGSAGEPVNSPVAEAISAAYGVPGFETRLNQQTEADIGFNCTLGGTLPASPICNRPNGFSNDTSHIASLKANWQFDGGVTLSALTGYQHYKGLNTSTDINGVPGGIFTVDSPSHYSNYSQEIRLSSPTDGRLTWTFGGSYIHDKWTFNTQLDSNDASTLHFIGITFGATDLNYSQQYDDIAGFVFARYKLTPQLSVSAAGRYTYESKRAQAATIATRPGFFNRYGDPNPTSSTPGAYTAFPLTHLKRTGGDFDGNVVLQYDVTPAVMFYVSYGKGTKSAAFAAQPLITGYTQSVPEAVRLAGSLAKEVAYTAEIGGKLDFRQFGGIGYLNVTLFNVKVNGFQAGASDGPLNLYKSIPLRSRGVDVDGSWSPVHGLTLAAAFEYLDSLNEASGLRFPYAPKWSGTASADYTQKIGAYSLTGGISLDFRSDQLLSLDQLTTQYGASQRLNARIELASDAKWKLALIGRNLTNHITTTTAYGTVFGPPGFIINTDQPRTITLQVQYGF